MLHHSVPCSRNWWLRSDRSKTGFVVIKLWTFKCCLPLMVSTLTVMFDQFACQFYAVHLFQTGNRNHSCLCTYPVHLHVLKLQAKVITLHEVASKKNLREEGLCRSFWLKEKNKKREKRKLLFSSLPQHKELRYPLGILSISNWKSNCIGTLHTKMLEGLQSWSTS